MNNRKFVTILGVKIPFENIRSTPEMIAGWVSYKFHFTVLPPPPPPPFKRIITNVEIPE